MSHMSNEFAEERRFADWRLALKSILGFWLVYAATVIARALLGDDPWTSLHNKMPNIMAGIVLTLILYALLDSFTRRAPMYRKAVFAAALSAAAAIGQATTIFFLEPYFKPSKEEFRFQAREGYVVIEKGYQIRIERAASDPLVVTLPRMAQLDNEKRIRWIADSSVTWFFFFAAWSAFYLATLAQAQVLGAQRRAAQAEAAARAAQVRALRYQVNPHFLFNTLNSLSSLVMTGRAEKAEEMLLALSTFFRTSLSLDPSADVTLAEEIDLQRLYLDIEKVRFPSRLRVEIDIPKELESARLPALVLQPLVENAIKYGVSPTRDKVTLRIEARALGEGRLEIIVTNTGKPDAAPARDHDRVESTGVGLSNVCQRLNARFGAHAKCEFGPLPNGGYQVHIIMPLDRSNG
jgi:two-component system LytT family sensor kinase